MSVIMRLILLLAMLVSSVAVSAADPPTDIGVSSTSSNPAGQISGLRVNLADNNTANTPDSNKMGVKDNDVDLTPNPTCSNAGTAGEVTLLDVDESASDDWVICFGTSQAFDIPDTGSDVIASAQILVGTGAGAGAYVAMSGDIGIDNAGATTVQANAVALGTDTTGAYVGDVAGGVGLAASGGGSENATVTLATASTEAGFLIDGDTTDLTCGTSNQGKLQVLNDGQIQWCDGAVPSSLRRAAFGNSAGESTAAASDSVTLSTDTTGNYITSIATTAPLTGGAAGSEGATLTIACPTTTGSQAGCLSPTDWTTFNNKVTNAFTTIDTPDGNDPIADSPTDTLTLLASGIITVTGNQSNDTITFGATEVDGLTTNEINTLAADSGGATSGLAITAAGGAGIVTARSSDTVTVSTASTEAGFLTDGGTTDLTCSTSNQGKLQVMDAKPLQYCDGASTSTLRYAADGNATGEAIAVADNSVALGTDTTGNYVASFTCGSGISGCPSAGESTTGTLVAADTSATNELVAITADSGGATSGIAVSLLGDGNITTTRSSNTVTVAAASALTRDPEWDTAAEINAATTDDDFVNLTGTQTVSGAKTLSGNTTVTGRLIYGPGSTQAITAAGDAITVSAAFTYKGLTTVTGTTTLTSTPTIADGTATGQLLVLQNLDGTVTDCVKLQDQAILGSSNLRLRASTVTLCPVAGVPPSTIVLMFDGSEWVEINPGTIRVREDTNEKGLLAGLTFDGVPFDITGENITTSTVVSLLGQKIDPTETAAVGGGASPFALVNTAQTFTDTQTFNDGVVIEQSGGTDIITCGTTDTARCETVDPTSAQDVATKTYVDKTAIVLTASYSGAYGGAAGTDGLRTARRFITHVEAGGFSGARQAPMPTTCTVQTLAANLVQNSNGAAFNVLTSNVINVNIRKNGSSTGQAACTIAAGASSGSCSSLGTPSFTAPSGATMDMYQFSASCGNAGADCTDTTLVTLQVSFLCI